MWAVYKSKVALSGIPRRDHSNVQRRDNGGHSQSQRVGPSFLVVSTFPYTLYGGPREESFYRNMCSAELVAFHTWNISGLLGLSTHISQ
jgi:hypothetical protein